MKNLGYLQCEKGGYHTGQFLNIVCLQSLCGNNILCCCACIQQFHANHKTKTLKKLLIEADSLSKNYKQPSKKIQTKNRNCNTDIMTNIVANDQKQTFIRFLQLKKQFITQIDKLENNLINYYKSLQIEINKPQEQVKDLKTLLLQNMQLVQGSSNVQNLKSNVIKLIRSIQITQKSVGKSSGSQKPDEESYLNFLRNSNSQITDIVQKKFSDLYKKLKNSSQKMSKQIPRINSFWDNQLFKFSNVMHHPDIDVLNPFLVRANVDSVYQIAVMNPHLSFANEIQTFKFRINVTDLQWVAVGVCYKNIVEKSNYEFKFNDLGHGCYLISGNAGTWSHSDPDFNNAVKAFSFKQGDSITCAVFKDRISFIKDVPPEHQFSEQYSQREYFQLVIKHEQKDQLHPCIVSYYKNTEVQYIPSFSSQLSIADMPIFNFKFSNKWKHYETIILNDTHIYGCQPTQYKVCLLDSPIQTNQNIKQAKSVTFRITRSTGTWIGLGLCHKNIIIENNYDFNFDTQGHGCYMISANGGSWSHLDADYNNLVRAFKFVQGDLVTISLDQQNKKIHFKRSIDKYQLLYEPVQGDLLYPVVVLYFPDDQIQVLPSFQ